MAQFDALEYYIDTLTDYLQEFLNRNEIDCTVSFGPDFAYWYKISDISVSCIVPEAKNDSFLNFVKILFPEIKADIFLWSFLHEVGHHETIDDFDDLEHQVYQFIVQRAEISDEYYYNLPIEKAATEWAGEFMKNNVSEVQRLWNNIQPVLKRLYTEI